ncbi:MAG: hypothetical protein A2589_00685 [Candidatus Vogelbacteria bacterium RIFOXYD1_FULL_46_19]|uniref:Triosephosphate isomerase n=1 Tax=Candidatus Vogelbacteria bacterium RIFOXYD1_FULL_46_19 TaxID=1802439 RepID=A0A1G2QI88_9BACT|nr:MAG: hypothetical protein A2589_00685 [Candidatus Vogelbacteria bacterium RIFOXYD1_FULL_46_19]
MTGMKDKLIVFNWKMNPAEAKEARWLGAKVKTISSRLKKVQTVMVPPAVFLPLLTSTKPSRRWSLSAQDISLEKETGAFTGEISATQVASVGAKYVIVGHSERRGRGDTDDVVRGKLMAGLMAGLSVILCVGEKARDAHGAYLDFLRAQLISATKACRRADFKNLIIAYEPVWAVGDQAAGADTPDNFFHNALFIRKVISGLAGQETALSIPILYGGSVNSANAVEFLAAGRADGLLIGRASLVPEEVKAILLLADQVKVKVKVKK